MNPTEVRTIDEAEQWFLKYHEGAVLCVFDKPDGGRRLTTAESFVDARYFFEDCLREYPPCER